jgi:hypothetical protein
MNYYHYEECQWIDGRQTVQLFQQSSSRYPLFQNLSTSGTARTFNSI